MKIDELITELGYDVSPNFLRAEGTRDFSQTVDYGQTLRRAAEHCQLKGVYSLHQSREDAHETVIPIVYVCEAKNDDDAENIHRLVWNQNIAPFLIVVSQKTIRLYSGFRYERAENAAKTPEQGLLRAATTIEEAMSFLGSFRSARVDDGTLWEDWAKEITPETRVDWSLLSKLNSLDEWLQTSGLTSEASHSLIGKYVYLYYLRHRDILSDRKLAKWGLNQESIFSRSPNLNAFWTVVEKLDVWLNGSAFVLERSKQAGLTESQLRKVAGTFRGDDPSTGQLTFDFDMYDFSFIPIETISVIYEQFLHSPDQQGSSTGKQSGAFYTPIPLVNFMLEELDSLHPFHKGMKILDPSCGSGAFLVQCYRRIVEMDDEFVPGESMRPARLRDLLESHIFGIDRDGDACRVAELSLSLTLLDYVDPPDLESTPSFQLPSLHGTNIFEGDFFDQTATWRHTLAEVKFDWIVGNPPWIELKSGRIDPRDKPVWDWMQKVENRKRFPIGGNQVAEAFAWEVTNHLAVSGYAGLLLPAMTLFKDETSTFRKGFFKDLTVRSVANFSNLAYVLFPGHKRRIGSVTKTFRSERPAAGFFYTKKSGDELERPIWVFSPLVADQPANRPGSRRPHGRQNIWNIIVSANQVQAVDVADAASGSLLPWKLAMWGSHLDRRLIQQVSKAHAPFFEFCNSAGLAVSQGIELRSEDANEALEEVPELDGCWEVKSGWMRGEAKAFEFPRSSLDPIPASRCFVRKGRKNKPLEVCRPPHIIVDKLRRYAIYSNECIAVPPREIGISGDATQSSLLKSLSLYLNSDFAIYHQFLFSPEWGVSTSISTLDTLRCLPIPRTLLEARQISEWEALHAEIVGVAGTQQFFYEEHHETTPKRELKELLGDLNERTYNLLGLRSDQRSLVSDLVNLRMKLIKGKTTKETTRPPTETELKSYALALRDELDTFTDDPVSLKHRVLIGKRSNHGIVSISLEQSSDRAIPVEVVDISKSLNDSFVAVSDPLQRRHNQWLYFERDVRLYEGTNTFILKPFERLHWTATKAQLDAGNVISETLSG